MAVLIRPTRWSQPPPPSATIDFSHPLAQGLAFAVVAGQGGGHPTDLVRRSVGFTLNAMPGWKPQGLSYSGATGVGSGTGTQFAGIPDAPFLTASGLSVVFGGSIDVGSQFNAMLTKANSNGAFQNPFDFRTDSNASPSLVFVRANGTGGNTANIFTATQTIAAAGSGLGVMSQYAATVADHQTQTVPVFYIGAKTLGTASNLAGTGAVTGSNSNLLVGRRGDGATQLNGTMRYAYAYGRALSPAEIEWLYAEPYAMLQTAKPRSRILSTGLRLGATRRTKTARPPSRQQPSTPQLNTNHPLAQGLALAAVMTGAGAPVDLVTGKQFTVTGLKQGPTAVGQGALFDGTSATTASIPLNLFPLTKITVSAWMHWDAYANDDLFAWEHTPNFNTTPGGFLFDPNSAGPSGVLFAAHSSSGPIYNSCSATRPSPGLHHFAVTHDRTVGAGGTQVFVDGLRVATAFPHVTQGGNFINATLYLMSRGSTSFFGKGRLPLLLVHNRQLSDVEIMRLYTEPYTLFQSSPRWLPTSALDLPFSDNFDKADSTTAGASLTFTDIVGDLQNVSNHAATLIDSLSARSRAEQDTATTTQFGEVVGNLATPTTSVTQIGVCLRYSTYADTCYRATVQRGSGPADTVVIAKIVAGTVTALASVSVTWTQGDTLRFEANGSLLTVLQNGAVRLSVVDTSITTGTRGGVHVFAPEPGALPGTYIDSFTYGDLVTTTPVLTNLKGWWKADSIIQADNTGITSWVDSSGNGYTATNVGTPLFRTNQLNGRPAVSLGGVQYLTADALAAVFSGTRKPMTVFCVCQPTSVAGTNDYLGLGRSTDLVPVVALSSNDVTGHPSFTLRDDSNHLITTTATPTFQQRLGHNSGPGVASLVVTLTSSATAGNTAFLAIKTAGGFGISAITDSRGNTWTIDKSSALSGSVAHLARTSMNAGTLVSGDTVTIVPSSSCNVGAAIYEYSGVLTVSNPVDASASASTSGANASTLASGATGTTSQGGELALSVIAIGGSTGPAYTIPTGYTERDTGEQNNTYCSMDLAEKIVATPGTEAPGWSWTGSVAAGSVVVTYKAATPSLAGSVAANTWHLFGYRDNLTTVGTFRDGATDIAPISDTAVSGNLTLDRFTIGALVRISAAGQFTGSIAELLVYDRALTDSERIVVEGYLATKYNLPLATQKRAFLLYDQAVRRASVI